MSKWNDVDFPNFLCVLSGIIFIVFVCFFGTVEKNDWKEIVIEKYTPNILYSNKRVYVEWNSVENGLPERNKDYIIYDSQEEYHDIITDSAQFYIIRGINHYGGDAGYERDYGKYLDKLYEKYGNDTIKTPEIVEEKYN